jgi:hypothetical protein
MISRALFFALIVALPFASGAALAENCDQAAFSAVVDEARNRLEALNIENKQEFQQKLGELREKRGWSKDDFVKNARPLVQDAGIASFDARHEELLTRVPKIGQADRPVASLAGIAPAGESASDSRCVMLDELRSLMGQVIENTRAKWAYMHGKTDAALTQSASSQ